jgi:hypothetical protein
MPCDNKIIEELTVDRSLFEKGEDPSNIVLRWKLNRSVISEQRINGMKLNPNLRFYVVNNVNVESDDVRFNLSVKHNGIESHGSVDIHFRKKIFIGVSSKETLTSEEVIALNYSEFDVLDEQTYNIRCDDQYIHMAIPATLKHPKFFVNGFLNTAWVKTGLMVTNKHGHTSPYYVYRSLYKLNGYNVDLRMDKIK